MDSNDNRILYIDDEEVNLLLFETLFSKHYQIHLAHSTVEAEKMLATTQFKVVVSDISMPQETGLDFVKRIHFDKNEPIFIILTAHFNNELLLKAINQGRIFRYLTKPWKSDEVKVTIDQAIQIYDLHYSNHALHQQMLENQRNFYNIFQASQSGIVIFSMNEVVLEANTAFIRNINSNINLITGLKFNECLPSGFYQKFKEVITKFLQDQISTNEFEYFTESGDKRIIEVNNFVIEYMKESAIMSIHRDITERRSNEQKILNAVILAEEKERSRLAKDLHDGLGPIMATLKMYLEWLNDQDKLSDHPDVLGLSLHTINEAIVTIKNISNNLSPHVLEKFGLSSALTSYIDKVKKISPILFSLSVTLTERFVLALEMSVYRILTECISNSIRHSGATEIQINIRKSKNTLCFTCKDNGSGFNVTEVLASSKGMGLHNIKNRIRTLGGKINIQSELGKGTIIESEIPLN